MAGPSSTDRLPARRSDGYAETRRCSSGRAPCRLGHLLAGEAAVAGENRTRLGASNRDPLAEWSEHLVATLTGGSLAPRRVQAAYDVTVPDELTVQVRYLANPSATWVNEHHARTLPGADRYALVLFEAFTLTGVVIFPPDLTAIGAALDKRHGDQQVTLQFTRRNWWTIRDDPDSFRELGVVVWLPPFDTE